MPNSDWTAHYVARGQRAAILASPPYELTGFYLAVDCLAPVPWRAQLRRGDVGLLRPGGWGGAAPHALCGGRELRRIAVLAE
jgi:hypothetical protein